MTLLIVDGSGNPTTSFNQTPSQVATLIAAALVAAVPPIRIEARNS
jgi:hypothetical protein